jgi:nitrogen fixation/metabolism regulation signal transduction histidine kinase
MSDTSFKIDIAIIAVAIVSLYLSASTLAAIKKDDSAKAKKYTGWTVALSSLIILGVGYVIYDTKYGTGTIRKSIASGFGI